MAVGWCQLTPRDQVPELDPVARNVAHLLAKIDAPEYRHLTIEALVALGDFFRENPRFILSEYLVLDLIMDTAYGWPGFRTTREMPTRIKSPDLATLLRGASGVGSPLDRCGAALSGGTGAAAQHKIEPRPAHIAHRRSARERAKRRLRWVSGRFTPHAI